MTLTPGARLGVYEVTEQIGEGGMGQVFRATDTKLKRQVAIKILPPALAHDQDRLARFQREAEVLASLNHPHIAGIYGLEESDGVSALVMELVDGEDLSQRIARGAIPIDEALPIAKQIADALEAAHEKGIVHRDLKPANIKVREDGTVKVLDFGLAKAMEPVAASVRDLSQSPTVTAPAMTQEGGIFGTPTYMSPEQTRGKPVDRRSDIWSFGCVLYEMLTGRVAFAGDTGSDTIARILEREPDWRLLPADTPSGVVRALQRSLTKDPKYRLHDIADMRIELDEASMAPFAVSHPTPKWSTRQIVVWSIAAGIVIAVAMVAVRLLRSSSRAAFATEQTVRFTIQFPSDAPSSGASTGTTGSQVALSPDAAYVAFVARPVEGSNRLYLRRIDELESRPVPGTDNAVDPFFSPDSQWVGYFAGEKLMKAPVAGGLPQIICELDATAVPSGASWDSDNDVVFAKGAGGLWRVSSNGGTPTAVTKLEDKEIDHAWPEVLPGSRAVLFNAVTKTGDSQIYVQSLTTGGRRALATGSGPHYLPSGHLVFGRGNSLFAAGFDTVRLETTSAPIRVLDNVTADGRVPQMGVSRVGSFVFIPRRPVPSVIVAVDRAGAEHSLSMPARLYSQPRLSPDEQRLAVLIFAESVAGSDAWLWDLSLENLNRLTSEGGLNYLLWTPDGHRVSFLSSQAHAGARIRIAWKRVDDSNSVEEPVLSGDVVGPPTSWSPDGRVLAFVNLHPINRQDIWTLRLDAQHKPQPFVTTRFAEGSPAFSPDGRWLAYVSDESGRSEVYVQPFPGPGQKVSISKDGGTEPVWPRRGHELFYRNGDAMIAVEVSSSATFAIGKTRRLFNGRYERSTALWPNYDVTPDGQRFFMVKTIERFVSATQINVVLNWQEELKQRVPTR